MFLSFRRLFIKDVSFACGQCCQHVPASDPSPRIPKVSSQSVQRRRTNQRGAQSPRESGPRAPPHQTEGHNSLTTQSRPESRPWLCTPSPPKTQDRSKTGGLNWEVWKTCYTQPWPRGVSAHLDASGEDIASGAPDPIDAPPSPPKKKVNPHPFNCDWNWCWCGNWNWCWNWCKFPPDITRAFSICETLIEKRK